MVISPIGYLPQKCYELWDAAWKLGTWERIGSIWKIRNISVLHKCDTKPPTMDNGKIITSNWE